MDISAELFASPVPLTNRTHVVPRTTPECNRSASSVDDFLPIFFKSATRPLPRHNSNHSTPVSRRVTPPRSTTSASRRLLNNSNSGLVRQAQISAQKLAAEQFRHSEEERRSAKKEGAAAFSQLTSAAVATAASLGSRNGSHSQLPSTTPQRQTVERMNLTSCPLCGNRLALPQAPECIIDSIWRSEISAFASSLKRL